MTVLCWLVSRQTSKMLQLWMVRFHSDTLTCMSWGSFPPVSPTIFQTFVLEILQSFGQNHERSQSNWLLCFYRFWLSDFHSIYGMFNNLFLFFSGYKKPWPIWQYFKMRRRSGSSGRSWRPSTRLTWGLWPPARSRLVLGGLKRKKSLTEL